MAEKGGGTISIHTLAWRVTHINKFISILLTISIHTLAWRVTHNGTLIIGEVGISIHTLAWRVTMLAYR